MHGQSISAIGGAAVILALGYLTVTLIFQVRPFSARFPRLDRLGILPRWKFFAQCTGGSDIAIEMRGRFRDGRLGDWTAIRTCPPRQPWSFVWYPEQYQTVIFWLAVEALERRAARGRDADSANSLAYSTILNHCSRAPSRPRGCDAHQFALVRTWHAKGGEARCTVFTSAFHTC